jgi:hypothetical protein
MLKVVSVELAKLHATLPMRGQLILVKIVTLFSSASFCHKYRLRKIWFKLNQSAQEIENATSREVALRIL